MPESVLPDLRVLGGDEMKTVNFNVLTSRRPSDVRSRHPSDCLRTCRKASQETDPVDTLCLALLPAGG